MGAKAQEHYHGDGLAVRPDAGGAALRCVFQKLEGQVTSEGLRLSSTAEQVAGTPFRVLAQSVGRADAGMCLLENTGKVETAANLARFVRPGLVEEYSASADGVRQDFIVTERPEGKGTLRIDLGIEGAAAEKAAEGARLVLADSGRKLAYHRLKVTDAHGRALTARMEVKSAGRIEVVVRDAAAVYPIRIDPTFSDANWMSLGGGLQGTDGGVKAVLLDGLGNLYIGGSFSVVGSTAANNIARWDGTNWFALGTGTDDEVNALALDSSGVLYAGGAFFNAGGESANAIAKWDGTAWSSLGVGVDNGVDDIVLSLAGDSAGNVYVGGYFGGAGAISADFIAKWDGTDWSALGTGMDGPVITLKVDSSGNLYAGGFFAFADAVPASGVAKWDGSGWSPLGDGVGDAVFSLALDGSGNVYVGGSFTNAGVVPANYVAKWDGTNWSALGDGTDFVVFSVASDGVGGIYAGGIFDTAGGVTVNGIAHWDGTVWSDLDGGVDDFVGSGVIAMAVDASGNLIAGGAIPSIGGTPVGGLGLWDGISWSSLTAGDPGNTGLDDSVYALVADGSGNVYAGGFFTMAGGTNANHVAKWDGTAWVSLGAGLDGPAHALLLDGSGNLYAGGSFGMADGSPANNIAKWDGANWSALAGGTDDNVYALALDSSGNLYVGGEFANADGGPASYVAKWDGMAWSALGAGTDNTVRALVVDSSGNLFVGGSFTFAGGSPANYLAKWDGATWSALASEVDNTVRALVFDGSGALYAGGDFTNACGVTVNRIAKWDGSTWAGLGDGMDDSVRALTFDPAGNLFAAGYFSSAGTEHVYGIARWDGAAWSALGTGLDNVSRALTVDSAGDLYVGGDFAFAGDKLSTFAARFVLNFAGIAVETDTGSLEDGFGAVDFGLIPFGGDSSHIFRITNSGTLTLTGLAITKDGPNAADFTLDEGGLLTTLAPGESTSFLVDFQPSAGGDRTAALHIASNAVGDSNPFDIALIGTGDVGDAVIVIDNSSVEENKPAGTLVGILSATDMDPLDTFTFSLPCGCDDNLLFQIVGDHLVTRGPFDFEFQSSYQVHVRAVNSGGQEYFQDFTIDVIDINEPPVFRGYSFTALKDTPATINWTKVLVRVSDPDFGGGIIVNTVDTTSAQGGVVELVANAIKYTPPVGYVGNDSFTITFDDDPYSASLVATVFITVNEGSSGIGATSLSVTAVGSDVELKFAGIPDAHYLLQRSETLTPPLNWTTLTNITANASGVVIYTDPSPPSPSYWRTIAAP